MGCDVACPIVRAKYVEEWDLEDPIGKGYDKYKEIILEIDRKVQNLKYKIDKKIIKV